MQLSAHIMPASQPQVGKELSDDDSANMTTHNSPTAGRETEGRDDTRVAEDKWKYYNRKLLNL